MLPYRSVKYPRSAAEILPEATLSVGLDIAYSTNSGFERTPFVGRLQ
jgi:hypothetical protein